MTDTRLDWLTLHRACATGSAAALKALEASAGDPALAWRRVVGARAGVAAVDQAQRDAELDLAWIEAERITLIPVASTSYPPLLRRVAGAPLLLFVRGDADALWMPQLAIVGSRQGTAGGLATARDFAATFVARGFAVASGLAAGIDAAAHQGALDAAGRTVAVLGTGLDRIYPARHVGLARAIVDGGGALVSEFPPRTPARRENFPRRNRIISGLSLGTLVVEASLNSGSLITARIAADQGREVFAIPGSIHNPLAKGCHQLIRDGAKLVETAQEVIDELAPMVREWRDTLLPLQPLPERSATSPTPGRVASEDADYTRLRQALGFDPVSLDTLVQRTGLTVPVLSSMLLRMELEGEVVANPGGTYSRCAG